MLSREPTIKARFFDHHQVFHRRQTFLLLSCWAIFTTHSSVFAVSEITQAEFWNPLTSAEIIEQEIHELERQIATGSPSVEKWREEKTIADYFWLKRAWETKAGNLKCLSIIKNADDNAKALLKLKKDSPDALLTLAEHDKVLPGIVGGDKSRAVREADLAFSKIGELKLSEPKQAFTLFRILLFYLYQNDKTETLTPSDAGKVEQLLQVFESQSSSTKKDPEWQYIFHWLPYSRAVYYFYLGDFSKVEKPLVQHLERLPISNWGYYLLWRNLLKSGAPADQIEAALKHAETDGKTLNDQPFLERLKLEAGRVKKGLKPT